VDKVIRRIIKTHGIIGGGKANLHILIFYIKSKIKLLRSPVKILKFRRDKFIDMFFLMAVFIKIIGEAVF
jgi:hypothetical protein